MEAALKLLLPKLLSSAASTSSEPTFKIHAHQGKQDLLKSLPAKLRGYSNWLPDSYRIVVIIDRDDDDCRTLKDRLEQIALQVGLPTKSSSQTNRYRVVNRVAIEELEAWFFGDWNAVRSAYPRVSANVPMQSKYRQPDNIAGGTWEGFERVLKAAGYFKTGLRKIEAARAVASRMEPDKNRSPSFHALRDALEHVANS